MSTLKVGIADPEEMKARTMRVAKGEEAPALGEPTVWFASTMSFAKLLSPANCELLRIVREQEPESLEELAQITGRAKSNLSRTLKAPLVPVTSRYLMARMSKLWTLATTPSFHPPATNSAARSFSSPAT
ncbi:hypothetical protein [Fodinicurvata sediminis]|uniref:HVO_A0114 family putative DNA-binding protein n=1 Tax=Fodinicurvata sediminis TaxID=1121832 RepID=UPI003F58414A